MKPKKVFSVSEFKSKSLGLLEEVARTGESITVTKRGKPIARVVPFREAGEKPKPDTLKDTLIELGDIVTPFGAKMWKAAEPEK
jgi:prevent-host-death family protein